MPRFPILTNAIFGRENAPVTEGFTREDDVAAVELSASALTVSLSQTSPAPPPPPPLPSDGVFAASLVLDVHRLDGLTDGSTVPTGNALPLPATGAQAIAPGQSTKLSAWRNGAEIPLGVVELDGRYPNGNLLAVRLVVQTATPTGTPDPVEVRWGAARTRSLAPGTEYTDDPGLWGVEVDPANRTRVRLTSDIRVWEQASKKIVRVPAGTPVSWASTADTVAAGGSATYAVLVKGDGTLVADKNSFYSDRTIAGSFKVSVAAGGSGFTAGTTPLDVAPVSVATAGSTLPALPAAILWPQATDYLCKVAQPTGPLVAYAETQADPLLTDLAAVARTVETNKVPYGYGRWFRAGGASYTGSANYDGGVSLYELAMRQTGANALDWWCQAHSGIAIWRNAYNGTASWLYNEWQCNSRVLFVDYLLTGHPGNLTALDRAADKPHEQAWANGYYDLQNPYNNDSSGRWLVRLCEASPYAHVLGRPYAARWQNRETAATAASGFAAASFLDRYKQAIAYLLTQIDPAPNAGRILTKKYRRDYVDPVTGRRGQHVHYLTGLLKQTFLDYERLIGPVPADWLAAYDQVTAWEWANLRRTTPTADHTSPQYMTYLPFYDPYEGGDQPGDAQPLNGDHVDYVAWRAVATGDPALALQAEQMLRALGMVVYVGDWWGDPKQVQETMKGYGRAWAYLRQYRAQHGVPA